MAMAFKSSPFVIGLTGSMGAGKSTVLSYFHLRGLPVFSADRCVESLYREDRDLQREILGFEGFPQDTRAAVFKAAVRRYVAEYPRRLAPIAAAVQKRVRKHAEHFVNQGGHRPACVLEVPLLFEACWEDLCDYVLAVTVSETIRRRRVMARPSMTAAAFRLLESRHLEGAAVLRRADGVLNTTEAPAVVRRRFGFLLQKILLDCKS